MKKIFLLHCFPVPYRNYLFELMYVESTKRNINLLILFYDNFDSSRPNWKFESKDLEFNNKFFKPVFHFGPVLHLNFDLLFYIFSEKPDLIITGGVWSSLNSVLLILVNKFKIIAWDETNRFDFGSIKKRFIYFKRFIVKYVKYFAIPGVESKLYYEELLGLSEFSKKKYFNLPNLINENLFTNSRNLRHEIISEFEDKFEFINFNKIIVYWPARYIPEKGIINFINNLDEDILSNVQILLVGHGPLELTIYKHIHMRSFEKHIYMIPSMPYLESIKFFSISDLVIMPSLSDSNPLSLIEAIHSSLPILISNRVGNLSEVLIEDFNGNSFDPENSKQVKKYINYYFRLSKNDLLTLGLNSKKIANLNFNSKLVVKKFFDDIEKDIL